MNILKFFIIRFFAQKKIVHQQLDFSQIQSVLLKPIGDALGDAIVHTAHLKQLKDAFPHLRIGVFISERNKIIFQQSGLVDQLLVDNWQTYIQQSKKWDLYLDFMPTFTSKSIIGDKLLSVKYVINFGKTEKKYYNLNTIKNYDFTTALLPQTHFKDYLNQSVLAPFLTNSVSYFLPLTAEQKQHAKQYWQPNKLRILLCPQGSIRQIPVSEFANLLQQIIPAEGVQWQLSHAEGAANYLLQLNNYPNLPQITLLPKTDLLSYFALVDSADIVLAVDGGAVHVACACSKPLLAFYANYPVSYHKWYPNIKIKSQDCCVIISKTVAENANQTSDFPLADAIDWLNQQIAKRLVSS